MRTGKKPSRGYGPDSRGSRRIRCGKKPFARLWAGPPEGKREQGGSTAPRAKPRCAATGEGMSGAVPASGVWGIRPLRGRYRYGVSSFFERLGKNHFPQ